MRDFVGSAFPNEFIRRYHHNDIEDTSKLGGADPVVTRGYFTNTFLQAFERGVRQGFFIYLDQVTIEQLAAAPSGRALTAMGLKEQCRIAWLHWVNVTEARTCLDALYAQQPNGTGEIGIEGVGSDYDPPWGGLQKPEWFFCTPGDSHAQELDEEV